MSTHLAPEELLDAAEQADAAAHQAFPHLETCRSCREQVTDLRQTMAMTAADEPPEPSPLFWEHLAARIHDAVAAEKIPAARWWQVFSPGRVALAAAALAAIVLAAGLSLRVTRTPQTPPVTAAATSSSSAATVSPAEEEAALQLIADLSSDLDWDTAADAGLMPSAGWVEAVVSELNDAERATLERLLHEEISRL